MDKADKASDSGVITPAERFMRLEIAVDRLTERVHKLEYTIVFFTGSVAVLSPILTALLVRWLS